MPLQNLISLRQSDAATVFLGCEIKLEDLVVSILRDSTTRVVNLGHDGMLLKPRRDGERPSLGHGLNAIDHDIENRLLHQIHVNLHWKALIGHSAQDGNAMLFGIGSG